MPKTTAIAFSRFEIYFFRLNKLKKKCKRKNSRFSRGFSGQGGHGDISVYN